MSEWLLSETVRVNKGDTVEVPDGQFYGEVMPLIVHHTDGTKTEYPMRRVPVSANEERA
jgi:hypothetical protein